jgi:lysophospholipase L1-like esterase
MYTFLALGDSYTIGEAVPIHESFPYQTVRYLREKNIPIAAPEIVAKTGWTSTELAGHLKRIPLSPFYDFVTLLIGVNDQYRGESTENYRTQFEQLLQFALLKAGGHASNVFVLSIPDWGCTPFGKSKDPDKIHTEIDAFNKINRSICSEEGITYLDITPSTRKASQFPERVAGDGLHPSGKEYAEWSQPLAEMIYGRLKW